jgi:hypothetical protein
MFSDAAKYTYYMRRRKKLDQFKVLILVLHVRAEENDYNPQKFSGNATLKCFLKRKITAIISVHTIIIPLSRMMQIRRPTYRPAERERESNGSRYK